MPSLLSLFPYRFATTTTTTIIISIINLRRAAVTDIILLLILLVALSQPQSATSFLLSVHNNNRHYYYRYCSICTCACTTSTMVALYGQSSVSFRRGAANRSKTRLRVNTNNNNIVVIPDDPQLLLHRNDFNLNEQALRLIDWLSFRKNVFCITGAGLSTDSGIPDYRGHNGSYHSGTTPHTPIIHQKFMDSSSVRKRYWARSMIGWETFRNAKPNKGHYAITELERMKQIGVYMEDKVEYYDPQNRDEFMFTSGQRKLSVLTQNVDSLHEKAGSVIDDVLPIHGRNRVVKCVRCGHEIDRNRFQEELKESNSDWFAHQHNNNHNTILLGEEEDAQNTSKRDFNKLRPDGDAELLSKDTNYDEIVVPFCQRCGSSSSTTTTIAGKGRGGGEGFYKPDVVFFGDTVPKQRVALCHDAVQACDGILAIGTSLTVHSVYRHVRTASTKYGVSTAIVNVGETRAELEGLENIVKIEAPVGAVLQRCVELLTQK